MTAGTPQHRGTTKDGHRLRTKTSPRKAAARVGASEVLAVTQASTKVDAVAGTMVNLDSADNAEGVAMEGKEKTQEKKKAQKNGVAARDTKENALEQESVKDFVVTETRLGIAPSLQQSEGEIHKAKNTEANTKI